MHTPDTFAYVVLVDEHELVHTADDPFCRNSTCECHDDQEDIAAVHKYIVDGLLTPDEATLFVRGRTF